ncbi:Myb/SANT-like domain containing protein [Senna tora]|uniref:Myb/SANT-like domain containing protein n=1 Tax=Senna tora TaxID=362788 RepID=A0A834WUM2_9FABA|nr:Myb/SANT-like domain containing protein [Senna tora]
MEGDTRSSNIANAGSKHFLWTAHLDAFLGESMMEQYKKEEFENKDYLTKLQRKMEQKAPACGIKVKPYIQSHLKTNWHTIFDMVHGANASRFGWDTDRQSIYAENAIWNEYARVIDQIIF